MADMSKHGRNDDPVAGMCENVNPEVALALHDRLLDAEQLWRYFCRRDEMNAEIHLEIEHGQTAPNVRYSPITVAAERLANYLAFLYYGEPVDYMTARREIAEAQHEVESR